MRYRPLGNSGLLVSVTGLGCNNIGRRLDLARTRAVVDAAIDAGITLFDTADVYGNGGGSEELLGEVLAGRRDQVVLATKFGSPGGDLGYGPAAGAKGGRTCIRSGGRHRPTWLISTRSCRRPGVARPRQPSLDAVL